MKYLKRYKLFEEVQGTDEKRTLYDIIKNIDSDNERRDVVDVFNLSDEKTYLDDVDISLNGFSFYTNLNYLEEIFELSDDNVLSDIERVFQDYDTYEYYVDDDEMNYLPSYLDSESIDLVKEFAKEFDYDLNLDADDISNDNDINGFFQYIGISKDIEGNIISNISDAKTVALQECITEQVFNKQPIDWKWESNHYGIKSKYEYRVNVNYTKILKFLEDNNIIDDVYNFLDLFEKIGSIIPYQYSHEYEIGEYEMDSSYDDLNKQFVRDIEKYWDVDDKEAKQLLYSCLIKVDNIDEIKKRFYNIFWSHKVHNYIESKGWNDYYLTQFAKNEEKKLQEKNDKCYMWFGSDDFINRFDKSEYDDEFLDELQRTKMEIFGKNTGLL